MYTHLNVELGNYHIRERSSGSFSRRFQIPKPISGDSIEAKMEDGVLQVTLPKQTPSQCLATKKNIPIA